MTARRTTLLGLSVAAVLVLVGSPAGAAPPEVHHDGTFWDWNAPATFTSSEGSTGITITGPNGATLDTGFATTICTAGANWNASFTNYFAAKRQQLRQAHYTLSNVSAITHPTGTPQKYRRQTMTFTVASGGLTKKGEITFDYTPSDTVGGVNYCATRSLVIYSNQSKFATLRPTLVNINSSLVYTGPGPCTPAPSTPC